MPMPRNQLVSLDATRYYHVISRCVRRQFLCGIDTQTGQDFSHRRDWIRGRIFDLADVFAIDVCSYAVMSNHFHLVLSVDQARALGWDDREVATRWTHLFGGIPLVRSFAAGEKLSDAQLAAVKSKVDEYRKRLFDISWFMRCLNEPIARMANVEDNVTGRFWEGRFKSQALLDEAALIAAMAYVDLNPIRANMAQAPEESDYTAIEQRILEQNPKIASQVPEAMEKLPEDLQTAIGKLMPFADQAPKNPERAIPYEIQDYLELVDWSGRAVIEGKQGSIPENLPPILERLKIDPASYVKFINRSEKTRFGSFIGPLEKMRDLAERFGKSFLKGQTAAAQLFRPG
ncbi:MAG TPA: transposase [Wenzhouxiangellaceae bacterium]|nr:transposase [Wenzhouxiangellaceae bacterium]